MLPRFLAVLALIAMTAAHAAVPIPDPQFSKDSTETQKYSLGRPTALRFTPDGSQLFFLRSGPRDATRRLYVFDTATAQTRELITPQQLLGSADEVLSKEEKARRERLRLTAKGFASFDLTPDGKTLLLPLSGKLFAFDLATQKLRTLDDGAKPALDARLSPDGSKVAFVRDYDLYLRELKTGKELRLTRGGSETLQHGLPEFIAQEEMGRFQGFWFSPDGLTMAYEEADHSQVERFSIGDPAKPEIGSEGFYYPRPGKNNVRVRLGLMPIGGGATTWVKWDAEKYPYLLRVYWPKTEPVQAPLTLIVQSRDQREQAILTVDARGNSKTLLVQKDPAWLDPDFSFARWLPDGSGFLSASEESGEAQLLRYDASGRNAQVLVARGFDALSEVTDDGRVVATVFSTPLETQIWRIDPKLGPAAVPEVLARGPGERSAKLARQGGQYAITQATLDAPATTTVFAADGRRIAELPSVAELPRVWPEPELMTVEVGGNVFQVAVLKPRDFDARKKYPVIDSVYGGPTTNVVLASATAYLRDQWLADHGFIVVKTDNRGTPRRDREWARGFKDRDGQNGDALSVIVNDQAAVLLELAKKIPQMDASRIGITGWSYGGTASAAAVLLRPDVFKAAVAGAPVTDWADYDTHYTERYLDTPQANAGGYASSNLVARAGELTKPLLLIHGSGDDNVYFFHSLKFADALFKAGKPFEFLPLVNFTHMVANPLVQERLDGRVVEFLKRHLGAPTAP
ncbi:MAG: DPP IV N-terminal domain-containing protein [Pseudomonadota bacterium]